VISHAVAADSRLRLEIGDAFSGRSKREMLEHIAMVAVLLFWAVPFTRATGGRGVHTELIFSVLLLVVLAALPAWRAPAGSVALAATVAAAAELVCVFAPSGWYGSDVAAGYVIAGATFIAARRYVRDTERRLLVATCVCLAGLYQFEQAFVPWWGSETASTEMSGTFYWHNPYAAFLLPGAVIGIGLILERRRPWSTVGWLSTPICTAGIVFSSSRATMAALVVAWLLLAAVCLRRKNVLRAGGALAATAAVILVLPGPPFFPHYSAPWSATQARSSSGETLSQNGEYRIQFWRSAVQVAVHRPWVGSGFHELADASALYTPFGWARSPQAHNGYLQAFSDGGVLLGLPFLAAVLVALWWGLRQLWAALRTRAGPIDALDCSVGVALLALLAHSAVDFDWSHPSILVEVALLSATVAPPVVTTHVRRSSVVALTVMAGALITLVPALHQWQLSQPNFRYSTDHELDVAGAPFGNFRPAQAVLRAYVYQDRPLSVQDAARALALTADEAKVDIHDALLRDAVGASTHLNPDAVAEARATLDRIGGILPPYVPDFALVLSSAGQSRAARDVLADHIAAQATAGKVAPNLGDELAQWARTLGTGSRYACQLNSVEALLSDAQEANLPAPTAPCPRSDQGRG
jgi:O-antigen ligase